MQSGSDALVEPKSNGKPSIRSINPVNSHYHDDLRQLEPEEDLIELNSGPPTPQIQTDHLGTPIHRSGRSPPESNHGLKRYQAIQYVAKQKCPGTDAGF